MDKVFKMKLNICDFCHKNIPAADMVVMVMVQKFESSNPYVPRITETTQLDVCLECAHQNNMIKIAPDMLPKVGALTPEEIEQLTREP